MLKYLLVAAVMVAMVGCETDRERRTTTARRTSSSDSSFLRNAAQEGMTEVELARVAQDQASSPEVRQLAQQMLDDHSNSNQRLRQIARDQNVSLPTQLDVSHRAQLDRLATLRGESFDRQYIQTMLDAHERTIDLYDREARSGSNAQVRTFARDTLPTLRQHLQLARTTASDLGIYAYPRNER